MILALRTGKISVPSSMLRVKINGEDRNAVYVSPDEIRIEAYKPIEHINTSEIGVFDFESFGYIDFVLGHDYSEVKRQDGFDECTIKFHEQPSLTQLLERTCSVLSLSKSIDFDFPKLKLFASEFGDSIENNDYPYHLDPIIHDSVKEQLDEWYGQYAEMDFSSLSKDLCIYLHNYDLYNSIRKNGIETTLCTMESSIGLTEGALLHNVKRLYIGNEFCAHLQPTQKLLLDIFQEAKKLELEITWCTSFIEQHNEARYKELVDGVESWCMENKRIIEVVINDWGMLELVSSKDCFIPILGRLLNVRKKDPRLKHGWGFERNKERLGYNPLNSEHVNRFLDANKISRYEYEMHNHEITFPETSSNSVHFPFYQIGTSISCTLNALCVNGSRFHQTAIKGCKQYCSTFSTLFPKHLNMIGYQNSFLGYSGPEKLHEIASNSHVDRLVFFPVMMAESE
jgi:hypothetical protein